MRRRFLAMLLAVIMVFSMAVGVSAEQTGAENSSALSLVVTQGKGSVSVEVYLDHCDGVTNGSFTVAYDADVLTLADAVASESGAMCSINGEAAGSVVFAWIGSQLTDDKQLMLTLTLETDAAITSDLTYTVTSDGIYADTEAVEVAGDTVTVVYTPVDTSELEAAIKSAAGVKESLYTKESYASLTDALEKAKAILADTDASQAEVDAAAKKLTDAIAGLVPVKTDSDSGSNNENSETGDKTPIWLLIVLMVLSVAGIIIIVVMKNKGKRKGKGGRYLSVLLIVAMLMTMVPGNAFAVVVGQDDASGKDAVHNVAGTIVDGESGNSVGTISKIEGNADLKLEQNLTIDTATRYEDDQLVRVLVELEGEGLLDQGYTQNQIAAYGSRVKKDAMKLEMAQNDLVEEIQAIVKKSGLGNSDSVTAKYSYTVALNGVSVTVPYGTVQAIRKLSGVKGAYVVSEYLAPESASTDGAYDKNMYATGETFGSFQTWKDLGYTGAGMTIAIVDTGLDIDHPSFAAAPEGATMTLSDIEAVLTELNAYHLYNEMSAVPLTAEKLYYSEKVPFGFNYVDNSLSVTHDYDTQGDHGTHVAGISAANAVDGTDVVGVAPDAQVLVMKVFGKNGGAYTDDILAVIEDCILMDVDVVNMSLGSPAGFTEDSVLVNEVFSRVLDTDMILAIAAGNTNSAASGNSLGTNLNMTGDPDNGMINSPGTYIGSTTVASVENVAMKMPYFVAGSHSIAYVDVNYNFTDLAGEELEYVIIPNYGRADDYTGLDVSGKVAVVSRGGGDDINFMVKQENAYNAGAVALVVYNNVEGDLVSMYDAGFLPNVFISKANGEAMIENAGDDGVGTMEVKPAGDEIAVPNSVGGLMSDFSCWGVTPDLELSPDVTAPGGNIYSCYTDGKYGTMSGTSMACPHIAGMSALVLQYLHDVYPDLDEMEYHIAAEALIMSTAVPLKDENNILYSPRKQGAGSANVYSAITSPAYLVVAQANGEMTPKVSLGDDPDRTGVYTFSFDVVNMSAEELQYVLSGCALTDQFVEIDGVEYMGETGKDLGAKVTFNALNTGRYAAYDANGDGVSDMNDIQYMLDMYVGLVSMDESILKLVDLQDDDLLNTVDAQLLYLLLQNGYEDLDLLTVPANSTATVNVTVELTADDIAYMEKHYENGIYVDGFVRLFAQSEGAVDLSLPFVGFYGDWHDAPMFDTGWYYEDEEEVTYNRYLNVIFATLGEGENYAGLGINPYILEEYDPAHNVLSPNGDGYYDYVPEIYVSLMRAAELLDFTWTDDKTGEELYYEWYAYARKSYYWPAYGMAMPIVYTDGGCLPYTFYDENGKLMVEDLQHLTLTIRGYLDDGDLDEMEAGIPQPDHAWADESVEIPVVIDMKAPEIDVSSVVYFTEDGRNYVRFDVEDNYDIAAVVAMTLGGDSYEYIPVTTKKDDVDGEKDTITLDITGYDASFQLAICDYACNESYYELVNNANEGLKEDTFYAFRRYSTVQTTETYYVTDQLNGWYSFQTADNMMMHTAQGASGEATVYAAEYVDGYIFGAQAGKNGHNTLFVMEAGSWDRMPLGNEITMNKTVYEWPGKQGTYFPLKMIALDMTFDYTTDTMYILANALENYYFPEGETNILLSMDLMTGDVTVLGKIEPSSDEAFLALTLACDNDGVLYTINYENGQLYTINKTPTSTTAKYGYGVYHATSVDADGKVSYYPAAYTQSMTFDHKTNKLYWAGYQGKVGTAYFMELDKSNGDIISMTATENNGEMSGLFLVYDSGRDIISKNNLRGLSMLDSELYLKVGKNATLTVMPTPFNAEVGKLTWTSSDESVATVTDFGLVEAQGIGVCTITATKGRYKTTCTIHVSNVEGTLYAYSNENWLIMDAGYPDQAITVTDTMTMEGTVQAAAYAKGYLYVAAVEDSANYITNLYKLDPNSLTGVLVGSYQGNTTALAFNYSDGFLYGLSETEVAEGLSYELFRINMNTGMTTLVTNLDELFTPSEYELCSGALAIDYEGNFYVNGDICLGDWDYQKVLHRFGLNEVGELCDLVSFTGFSSFNEFYSDAMIWSESSGGILRVSGTQMEWVDVSDMENVQTISLGHIRTEGYYVVALAAPLAGEPETPVISATGISLEEVYTVPVGETVRVIPELFPWNATGEFLYEIADESIATVDENGIVTGILENNETTITVTDTISGLSATAKIVVEKNPGYLCGFAQADIAQGVPLSYWIRMPISAPANGRSMTDGFDFTIYAAAYFDGSIYAYGQSEIDYLYYILRIDAGTFHYEILNTCSVMLRDMAFDYTTGTMYAVGTNDAVAGGLYQMDITNGELTLIGDNDAGKLLVALACDAEGDLYVADESGNVYAMNNLTAELTATGIKGPTSQYLQSMAYDYNNDSIYWAVGGTLYLVDPDNRELASLGYADIDSGELASVGCIISGLYSIPRVAPTIPDEVDPMGVALADKNTVAVGETLTIDAVVLPVSTTIVNQKLTWTSADETVATVDENGVVTGVSAGQVYITATDAKGNSDSILITVTEEHRYFYGYDEITRSWVRFDTDGKIVNTWADDGSLSPIVAAQYIGDVLYAYDAEGYFYTIDTETFQRTKVGEGIHGVTTSLEAWDKANGAYYVDDIQYQVVDLTYASGTDGYTVYAALMAYNISQWQDSFTYQIVRIDLATGGISEVIVDNALVDGEMSLRPTNLLYRGGDLYTVNGYITGMVTKIDPEEGTVTGANIFAGYWGDFNGGRSMIEDPLTGRVYAIRDMRTDYIGTEGYTGAYAASELCTVHLGVARCDAIATIGTNMRIVGLFIK